MNADVLTTVHYHHSEVDKCRASPARARNRAPSNPQGGLTTPTDSAGHPDAVCVFTGVFKTENFEYICGNFGRYSGSVVTSRVSEGLTSVQNGGAC